jgi:PHD/YefM family antitoxin component YafN of YafNO toxin-antitoxin module
MRKTKEPMVLTVNGRAALVVQDAESYQQLLDAKERMEAIEGVRNGLESMKAKRSKPAEAFFAEFFSRNNLSERR